MKLWYEQEAKEWTQALPIANGHMGAMCYGGTAGRYDLSENTCWSGEPQPDPLKERAREAMREARECLLKKDYARGESLLEHCTGNKGNYGTQVPMGRLCVAVEAEAKAVYRELELFTGVALDKLELEGGTVYRKSFLSNPDKVMGVRVWAEGKLPALCLWTEGWSQPSHTDWKPEEQQLWVNGRALENIHSDGLTGAAYVIGLSYETDGNVNWSRRGLVLEGASSLTVWVTASTSMFDAAMEHTCRERLTAAQKLGWETVLARHVQEHREGMERCTFTMPDANGHLPTDERIRAFAEEKGGDDGLIALFFQYGRYLIFNSSRPDSLLPAALQGVWNDDRACRMMWTDDMHLDINTQMNYYPAENTGLGDSMLPLLRWVKDVLVPNGRKIARDLYGADGWCAHTVSNAYGWAAPGWDVCWGFAASCGGWISYHIWEHYLYTGDEGFLSEYYDILYGNAQFLSELLMEDGDTGYLLTVPGYSPENVYLYNGEGHSITAGTTFDTTVARTGFEIVRRAAEILGREDAFTASLAEKLEKLPPYRTGKYGQLREWFLDYEEAWPDHRHTCHLLSLHPFNAIDPVEQPELAEAVRISLNRRLGDNAQDIVYANWAGALLITYYARLLDGDRAGEFVKPMIAFLSRENMMITHQGPTTSITGGIYELDGNTGFTAAVAEMLVQGYGGVIRILPALPEEWRTGEYQGLRVYGGHAVSAKWDETAIACRLLAAADGEVTLRCFGQEKRLTVKKGEQYAFAFERKAQGGK